MKIFSLILVAFALMVSSGAEARKHHHGSRHIRHHHYQGSFDGGSVVANPSGCPSRAFCGCGASIEVFGRNIRELWLARAWFRFPPASPAPGMVAVRNHHVFVIREVRGNGIVLAYDANSGGHRTRIHERSLAGYSVRNPHGEHYAASKGVRYASYGAYESTGSSW